MRVGLVWERKRDYPWRAGDPEELDSELLAEFEADAVSSGLRDAGYVVLEIGDARQLLNRVGFWRRRLDIVFNLSVGYRGIERKLVTPAILDAAGIPYVGSSPYVLTLTRHKYHSKLIVRAVGVATPASVLFDRSMQPNALDHLTFPVIVKPVAESSGIGISTASVVRTVRDATNRAVEIQERYGQPALVETFIEGMECEVPLLIEPSPRALGVVAITLDGRNIDGSRFLTGSDVYNDGYGFRAIESPTFVESVKSMAERAAAALGIRDYGRVDVRVGSDGTPFFIEASSHPHIQRHSSFFVLAQRRGLQYHEFLRELVEIGARRAGLL